MIYKTKICTHVVEKGSCPYTYCCYAHNDSVYIIFI